MLVEVGDVGVHYQVQHTGGQEVVEVAHLPLQRGHDLPLQHAAEFAHVAHCHGVHDGLLIGKETIERADGDARFGRDAGGRYLFQRHAAEQGTGRIRHPLDGLDAARLEGSAPRCRGAGAVLEQ